MWQMQKIALKTWIKNPSAPFRFIFKKCLHLNSTATIVYDYGSIKKEIIFCLLGVIANMVLLMVRVAIAKRH